MRLEGWPRASVSPSFETAASRPPQDEAATSCCIEPPSVRHSQIRIDDVLILLHVVRRAVGDLTPWSSTTTRSDRSITTPMSCSISAMVVPK